MTPRQPLFRADSLRAKLTTFVPPIEAERGRDHLRRWAAVARAGESGALPQFLADVFVDILGYADLSRSNTSGVYTFRREEHIPAAKTRADAVLGRFGGGDVGERVTVVVEGKGTDDPLDKPHGGRRLSAVEQAAAYALNLRCDWYVVTNMREIRLYAKSRDQATFEFFPVERLAADDAAFRRFVFVLGAARVTPAAGPGHLDALLTASAEAKRAMTAAFYREFADLRDRTFDGLKSANPGETPERLLGATQKILDRVLFVAFAAGRGLLPASAMRDAYAHGGRYSAHGVWGNFRALFRAVDRGNPQLEVAAYNGGLFAFDVLIDEALSVPDAVCARFARLEEFEYRPQAAGDDLLDPTPKLVDVEILGHVFEQSITDLEEMQAGRPPATASRRQLEGAFYTPEFVTRHLVGATLGPLLGDRFEALRRRNQGAAAGAARAALADPRELPTDPTPAVRKALVGFWNAWLDDLQSVRVLDPSCGSGAFLLEAFEQFAARYRECKDRLTALKAPVDLFRPDETILRNNLYGVDVNAEAVGVCRLGVWIRTAEEGRQLTSLDEKIRQGNSVVSDPTIHPAGLDWHGTFGHILGGGRI